MASRWRSHGTGRSRTTGTCTSLWWSSDVRRLTSDPAKMPGRRGRPTGARSRSFGNEPTIPPFTWSRRSAVRKDEWATSEAPIHWTGHRMVSGWRPGTPDTELRLLFALPRPGGKGPRGIYLVSVEGGAARPLIVSNSNRVDSKPAFSPDGRRLARLLRLFRRGHDRDAGLRCGSGRSRYVARHGAASPPADDAAVLLHPFPGMDARRQRHHLRCPRAGRQFQLVARDDRWQSRARAHRGRRRADRQPSPGRAIGSRSHACRSTPTSIDSKQTVLCSWWQDPALWIRLRLSLTAVGSRLPPRGRAGKMNGIWIAEADGSNPQQLTHGPGVSQGSPSWSPDGRRIAFDARGTPRTPIGTCG